MLLRNSRRKLSQGLLFWSETGEGIPVILLHGAWNNSSQWSLVIEKLAQDFHCFAPDLLGFGESEKTTDKSKANVTKLVMAGYDFVINSIKKVTPAQLSENVKLFGRFDLTKGAALAKCFEHQTHHRGQTTVYIRLAGAKPPQEKLF